MMKERLVSSFENWYINEFDVPVQGGNLIVEDEANLSSQEWLGGSEANVDAEQETFMHAKKKVEVLNRARKMDKQRRWLIIKSLHIHVNNRNIHY